MSDSPPLMHHFTALADLNNALMRFVRDGGVFIPTDQQCHLGDLVAVSLTLPNAQTFAFQGDVVWITSKSPQKHAGIGIQCTEDEGQAFQKAAKQLLEGYKEMSQPETM